MMATAAALTLLAGSASGAPRPQISEAALQKAFTGYLREWSSEQGISRSAMNRYYADHVIYYGKPMSRDEVFRDKVRYVAAWPERHYSVVPGSLSVTCTSDTSICRTRGLMRWDRRSTRGTRSTGTALLTLTASRQSGGKIVRESAVIRD